MDNLYDINGLFFWSEEEIRLRRMFERHFKAAILINLKTQNAGFEMVQIEAPLITPQELINPSYSADDIFLLANGTKQDTSFVLRPETTMGSYKALDLLLSPYRDRKYRLPLCVYQHGKSFRREQDQATKFMRLKEFYQLEFQIAYNDKTATDYSVKLIPAVQAAISSMIGSCRVEPSDRLPDYAESTTDLVCEKTGMEVCSISKRKDYSAAKILEVAIGTDRCIYNYQQREQ